VLGQQIVLGSAAVLVVVVFHAAALTALVAALRHGGKQLRHRPQLPRVGLLLTGGILAVVAAHVVEITAWAALFVYLGEFSDMRTALYFSGVTATSLGYGDIVLSQDWRLLSVFEVMSGLILFGASAAFLFALVQKLVQSVAEPSS